MAKSIIKELIIVLLLCLAIILVLGILLYEYVPVSKTIPNEVSYTTPEEVKEELLTSSDVDENQIVMTYEIDSTNYKKIQNYKPGKANPFSSYETQASGSNAGSSQTSGQNTTSNTNTNTSNGSDTSSSSNSSQSTDNTTTSGGKFFQDTGTK